MLKRLQNVVVIALALLLATGFGLEIWRASNAPRVSINQNAAQQKERSANAESPKESAEEAIARYNKWLTIFTAILAVATVGLGFATIGLYFVSQGQLKHAELESRRTRVHRAQDEMRIEEQINIARQNSNAAQKAAETLPIIEGAYVFPDILAENVASSLQNLDHPMVVNRVLRLEFQFKNFGKTPAILHHFQADLIHFDQGHMRSKDAEGRIAKKVVLGAGEAEHLQSTIGDFSKAEAVSVIAGRTQLSFTGYVVYGDVFGNKWGYSFDWQFSPTQGRLVPDNQPRKKIE